MGSRIVTVVLVALLAALQAQLWFGRGSVPRVASMQQQLRAQQDANEAAAESNQRLASGCRICARAWTWWRRRRAANSA